VIVNSINNRINPTVILANNRVSSAQLPRVKPNNTDSDSLQKQLSFMGRANIPLIEPISKLVEKSGTSILDKYFEKLNRFDLPEATILHKKEGAADLELMILNTPLHFNEALEALSKNIKKIEDNPLFELHDFYFDHYQQACQKNHKLQKTLIKGIAGQGLSSTAFLTTEGEIIKLTFEPLCPHRQHFAKKVEIPILDKYKEKLDDGSIVYGIKEQFTEVGSIRNMTLKQYNKIWDTLHDELKRVNPKFDFCDFKRNNLDYRMQLGFIEDTPYIIDHGCISGRPLIH